MKRLNVSISELEFNKFGLKDENLTFSELLNIISREITKQALEQTLNEADKVKLNEMTMEEITKEVNAYRKDAKGSH